MGGRNGNPNFYHRLRKHARYVYLYPGVMPRAAENYLRMALGERRLRAVEFALNFECNAGCGHCSVIRLNANRPDRPPLTLPQIKDTLRQCLDLGALNINITGGEPLLVPELPEVVRACRPGRAVVSLASNGVLVTRDKAREIASWGVAIVTMSMDSADPRRHDEIRRREGCFDLTMRAVDYLHEAGVEVFLNTILTYENWKNGDMLRMVEIAGEKGVMLTVNRACGVGGWENADLHPTMEMLKFHRGLMKIPHVRWEGSSNYFRDGCPAGIEKLYISHLGDVMPCNFAHISFGNVTERPLALIWEKMIAKSPFNKVHDLCLVAEDPRFQKDYLDPVKAGRVHPLPVEEHPAFSD